MTLVSTLGYLVGQKNANLCSKKTQNKNQPKIVRAQKFSIGNNLKLTLFLSIKYYVTN